MNFISNILDKTKKSPIHWITRLTTIIYYKGIIKNKGTYFMKEDWDNLIILDGCRYDSFEKINHINGKLEFRFSRGSSTSEFLKENFSGRKFSDTIYITSNPLVNYFVPDSFFKIISVWREGWHDEYGTVLPETVVENTLKVDKEFPNKRLIIHFMQPHYPYIGKRSRENIGYHDGILSHFLFQDSKDSKKAKHTTQLVWNLLKNGKIDKKTVLEAYEENLQIVLEHTESLIKILTGKTIITADHGNLFGERMLPFFIKEYGHPRATYKENLIKVPWFIINRERRKEIKKSERFEINKEEENCIKKRMKELGYIDY